jgi:hypothetical protein
MLFKMDPFANDSEILELEIEKRIQRLRSAPYGNGCPPIDISDEAADALCVMLSKEAYERPNVDELLDMPFFDIYDDE